MYEVGKNRKYTEWPQTELEDLTVKSTLHTLFTYPWGQNFGLYRSTTSRFREQDFPRLPNQRIQKVASPSEKYPASDRR